MDRREFLRLASMSSALLMISGHMLMGTEVDSRSAAYAGALREIPPGAVQPEGWLRRYLERQASQLGSKLPQVSWPFTEGYWAEEQEAEAWWPWEQKAYWIDGAARLALVLQDERLLEQAIKPIEYTLSHVDTEGYLGPEFFQDPMGDFHRWPHAVFFRGLAAVSDARSAQRAFTGARIVEALQMHYLSDRAKYGTPTRNVTNIEGILWCYEKTGDPRLLALAENAWRDYAKVAADPVHGDLSAQRVFAATPINAHGVTYAEIAKLPAILYLYTGRDEYLKFALAAQRRVFDHHMLIDGVPSTSEWFGTVTSLDSHETCDIADFTWSWGYLLMATGDAIWADRVERACFNAAPGAIKNDWKALQYFSCPNQILATLNSDHNWPLFDEHGGRMMAYQPNPGQHTACCAGNVHRIFPNFVIRMWMKSNNGGLAAVLYGPSKVNATVGPDNQPVEVVQTTDYPFSEQIHFKIRCGSAVSFPFSFRIPAWCDAPHLTVNGVTVATSRTPQGFIVLHRSFNPGDLITLALPMKVAVTRWPQNGIGIERGPLVYSLPIKEKWTTKVEPKYTTPEFPSWEAMPNSEWNYGLTLNAAKVDSEVEVKVRPIASEQVLDPWENPPIEIQVPARKVEDWELQANPDNTAQRFTPCLPDLRMSKISDTLEQVSLVPYGSTQLRVTIFPALQKPEGTLL
ncbi:MAG TPA: beta-L-arabinofuranosidase domain-containing protein [Terracidiphilus sp.]